MTYHGAGTWTPPGYAILHGSRPTIEGMQGIREKAFFYYPWLVLWKLISPHRVMNVLQLEDDLWELTYDDRSVLKLDVRANTWVYRKDGIVYDGYSPPNPSHDPLKSPYYWGMPWENFDPPFPRGSFAVWRSGTFTIKVPGVKRLKSVRVVGGPSEDIAPLQYTAEFSHGVLSVHIKDKDPIKHPMLVFESAAEPPPK